VKPYKVSTYCTVFAKHCNFNTKIDSPLFDKTPQKFLQQLAVVLSLKAWEKIFENDYYGLKKEIKVFHEYFKEFRVLFD